MNNNDFVHLHVHTEYSLLDGACKIKELVKAVKSLGQTAVAITDHGVMYGCIDFYNECVQNNIKPIIGCEVYVAPRTRFHKETKEDSSPHHLVLLCKNNTGYKNLTKLVSNAYIEGFYNRPRCDKETLRKYSEGLIALSACLAGEIPRHLINEQFNLALNSAKEYAEIFGKENFFIEVQDNALKAQREILPLLYKLADTLSLGVVATNDAHYINKSDAPAQRILTAISTNTTIHEKSGMLFEGDEFYIKDTNEMATLFREDAILNTKKIADRCNVSFEFGVTRLPLFKKENVTDNRDFFHKEVHKGLQNRYKNVTDEIINRAEYEMSVIDKMGFTDYFLIVADFTDYARKNDIPVGPGRGSGVGSICAYALGITSIDPIRFGLIFERFLNPERVSMPDFDIDFCYKRRGEVIEYVTNKYGRDHVAQIITFGTMAAKGAIRDTGRAMGMPYAKVDSIAKLIPQSMHPSISRSLKHEKAFKEQYDRDIEVQNLVNNAMKIEGMPRHPSVHAAGIVITRDPVTDYVPLQKTDNETVTQYPMGTLERLGLLKMDFLGLRYLTVIDNTAKKIGIDINKIDEYDKNVFDMLSKGGTSGVFQFESAGMTSVLMRLKPETLEDLIATISLYRPGPMSSIPTYIENRHNPEKIKYKHPLLEKILSVTYGCIVYQEQVMEICRTLAQFSYGRADLVRRAMSKKKMDVMTKEREAFIEGAGKNGVHENVANDIYDELTRFATYAFNKSHAAAYAYIAYQTAYLRYYHYKEYMTEMMTSVIDSAGKLSEYIADIKRHGIKLLPPDINHSYADFSSEKDGIRYGLLGVKNLGKNAINAIIRERENGEYKSFYEFCSRLLKLDTGKTDINRRTLEALIKSGSFDCFHNNRRALTLSYEEIYDIFTKNRSRNIEGQLDLFGNYEDGDDDTEVFKMPDVKEFPLFHLLQMEKDCVGIYLSGHPLDNFEKHARLHGYMKISDVINSVNENLFGFRSGDSVMVLGILTSKKQFVTKSNKMMCFGTLEDTTSSMGCIIFSDLYEKIAAELNLMRVIFATGTISIKDEEEPEIIIKSILFGDKIAIDTYNTLYINLEKTETLKLSRIAELIKENPGNEEVKICFSDTREVTVLKDISGVSVNKDLMNKLRKLCGVKNVKLK